MENSFIKQVAHQPKPVSIERAENDVIIIEGVRYSADYFRTMAHPNPNYLYELEIKEDTVWVTEIHNVTEAEQFFDRVFLAEAMDETLTPALSLKGEGEEGDNNAL